LEHPLDMADSPWRSKEPGSIKRPEIKRDELGCRPITGCNDWARWRVRRRGSAPSTTDASQLGKPSNPSFPTTAIRAGLICRHRFAVAIRIASLIPNPWPWARYPRHMSLGNFLCEMQ
jgi:hypothetical protein